MSSKDHGTQPEQPSDEVIGLDVIEPDPTEAPRPEEEAADTIRSEDPATQQP